MVIVRESPRVKLSPDKNEAQWPPKSPFHALLSSPSGRKKWQDRRNHADERETSPSPVKRVTGSSKALQALSVPSGDEDLEDMDEEEVAQLELARIEAQLKLKRIRQKKKWAAAEGSEKENGQRAASRAETGSASPVKGLRPSVSHSELQSRNVEVPLSPIRERAIPAEQLSPARRRLGLNGAAKAQDVSLKRARDGTQISRSESVHNAEVPRPRSFNDRLRASKEDAETYEAKQARVRKSRSSGFVTQGSTRSQSNSRKVQASRSPGRRRDETVRPSSARGAKPASKASNQSSVGRSSSTRSSQAASRPRPHASGLFQATGDNRPTNRAADSDSDLDITPADDETPTSSSYDPISETHLSKRHIPHTTVAREMEDKVIYTLPRLFKEVKAPDYEPPDCESDFVLFAILASKSSPYDQKQHHRTSDENKPQEDAKAPRNKFMVLHLTDLKWELDCFLFGTAFDQFWRLTPGTLLAILNPSILPPKVNQHSGRFSIKLGSSEDCVMEIGFARDLGYCTSVRKDGQQCGDWVDKRKTEICEFHLNLFIEKQRKGRMEVNTMWRGHGNGEDRVKSKSREEGGWDREMGKKKWEEINHRREYGVTYSVNTGMGKSAATLLDAEDVNQLEGYTVEEKSRKRIAAAEKERRLQRELKQLSKGGDDSVGAEYMRTKPGAASSTRSADRMAKEAKNLFDKPKIGDLGLLNNRADTTHLSPAKDRKHHFGMGAVSTAGRDAVGWGGARKAGLLQPKDNRLGSPEKGQTRLSVETTSGIRPPAVRTRSQDGSLSPSKKRARFMLADKGLREPGRESGGQDLRTPAATAGALDDDDELDIV